MDFIGFIISVLAVIYLFFRQRSLTRYHQEHPEVIESEEVEEDPLKEFMKEIEKETRARKAAVQQLPPTPPSKVMLPTKKIPLTSSLEDYHLKSEIEKRKLKSTLENRRVKTKLTQSIGEKHAPTIPLHLREELVTRRPSRALQALNRLTHKRDLLIYQEILSKPKSLRPFP